LPPCPFTQTHPSPARASSSFIIFNASTSTTHTPRNALTTSLHAVQRSHHVSHFTHPQPLARGCAHVLANMPFHATPSPSRVDALGPESGLGAAAMGGLRRRRSTRTWPQLPGLRSPAAYDAAARRGWSHCS
jgi:hypothetical protein